MAHTPEVEKLLAIALEFEHKLGFANSPNDHLATTDGGRLKTRLEVGNRWKELEAAVEAAKPACPMQVIALRTALANSLHHRMQSDIKPARDAVEAAACTIIDSRQTDTKADTEKNKSRRLKMNAAASDCARRYREAYTADSTISLKQVVSEYADEFGGSAEYFYRILNDNPDQWRVG